MIKLYVYMLSFSVVSDSLDPMDYSPPGSSLHENSSGKGRILEWVTMPSSRGYSQPKDQTQVSRIAGGFFPAEPPAGKPKNTGVGRLSLLQGNFPTQESNWDLLHCRRILYQLSCKGSPTNKGQVRLFWPCQLGYHLFPFF